MKSKGRFTDGGRIEYTFESMRNSGLPLLPNFGRNFGLLHWSRLRAVWALAALFTLAAPSMLRAAHRDRAKQLLIYSIDVEGGQSTLLVGPGGDTLLVDTGWSGHNGRDADRIQAAMRDAGVTKIDHLLITHFHVYHVCGVPNLV